MAVKKNELWKLDYLETKFNGANPRFRHTKRLITAKNNQQLLKKLPTTKTEADELISALKSEYFDRKYFGSYKKLHKQIGRILAADSKKPSFSAEISLFFNEENLGHLATSKLVKLLSSTILTSKELKSSPPSYISPEIATIITDKSHSSNPSAFFIKFCQNNKLLNNYISNMWNSKDMKAILQEIEWSFRLIRGNISKIERETRDKQLGKDSKKPSSDSEDEASSDEDDSSDASDNEDEPQDENMDAEEAFDKFAIYDKLVGDSDEEEQFELDQNVDYNQVTDEEPSDDEYEDESEEESDPFFEEEDKKEKKSKKEKKEKKESKHNLPQLASGYYSGGSDDEDDDDIDNDDVVKELTQVRKNRRGQRARQKIWAQKYGKEAKHIKEERQKIASEREQRQIDYEARERKRQEKARLAMENAPSGSNVQPLGERKPGSSATPTPVPEAIHPSWQAKKIAEEKQKNVKFEGKKIKFD